MFGSSQEVCKHRLYMVLRAATLLCAAVSINALWVPPPLKAFIP